MHVSLYGLIQAVRDGSRGSGVCNMVHASRPVTGGLGPVSVVN